MTAMSFPRFVAGLYIGGIVVCFALITWSLWRDTHPARWFRREWRRSKRQGQLDQWLRRMR